MNRRPIEQSSGVTLILHFHSLDFEKDVLFDFHAVLNVDSKDAATEAKRLSVPKESFKICVAPY